MYQKDPYRRNSSSLATPGNIDSDKNGHGSIEGSASYSDEEPSMFSLSAQRHFFIKSTSKSPSMLRCSTRPYLYEAK
jgi:hypothetical protein